MGKVRIEFIPFGEFKPDAGLFRNDGLTVPSRGVSDLTRNLIANNGGYVIAPGIEELETSEISTGVTGVLDPVTSLYVHLFGLSDWRAYAGDAGDLYEYDPGTPVVTNVSKSAGAYTGDEWFFAGFGDSILATNFVDPVQILLKTASAFADNFTSTDKPTCRYLSPFKSHIVGGNYVLGATAVPHGVFWTAVDNARVVGTPASLPAEATDYQPLLDDLGAVTGLAQGRDYLLIFRDRGIVRMDGPTAAGFSFSPIAISEGCRWPRSIVQMGDDTYYLADGAVKVVRNGVTIEDIGNARVNRFLFDNEFASMAISRDSGRPLSIKGCADPSSNQVMWFWEDNSLAPDTYSNAILYNTVERRWSFMQKPSDTSFWSHPALKAGTGEDWSLLHRVLFLLKTVAGGNDTWSIGRFSSAKTLSACAATGYIQHHPEHRSRVRWVRPVVRSGPSASVSDNLSITVASKDQPFASSDLSNPSLTEADREGRFLVSPAHVPGEFIRYSLVFGDDITPLTSREVEGLEVAIEDAGRSYGD